LSAFLEGRRMSRWTVCEAAVATDNMSNDTEAIFDAARKLSTAAGRKAFLDAACGENPELGRQIAELLAAQDEADRLFETGAAALRIASPGGPGVQSVSAATSSAE
jgi:hypothetical protein